LVIDAMLQAEFLHTCEFLVGGRGSVHLDAEQASDLHGGGTDSSCYSMNQDAMFAAGRRGFGHPGLPVQQICGEEVYWEGGSLFVGPVIRNWPKQVAISSDLFGEGSPLDVAHDSASTVLFHSGELATGDEGRRRGSGITSVDGKHVCEVQAPCSDADQHLPGFQLRLRDVLNGERVGTVQAGD